MPLTMSPLETKLRAEVEQELRATLRAEIQADADRRIEAIRAEERERSHIALARYATDVEKDVESRAEERCTRLVEAEMNAVSDDLTDLKSDLRQARQEARQAESALLALAVALFGASENWIHARRHLSIKRLDVTSLLPALERLGYVLRWKRTASDFAVELATAPGMTEPAHLFKLRKSVNGVAYDDTEETRIDAAH